LRLSPYLVHVGYSLMLAALLARDIVWLRGLLVCAQSTLAVYAWSIGAAGMTGWNLLFVLINTVWVIRILKERRAVELPLELRSLYHRHFAALTPPEFLRWWRHGRRETLRDARLAQFGEYPASLFFVLAGTVRISHGDRRVTDLGPGYFVAEMSLLTGEPATADAVAIGDVDVMRWPADELREMKARQPAIWVKIQSVLGRDLVEKIGAGAHKG
jgi:hypothetical protein